MSIDITDVESERLSCLLCLTEIFPVEIVKLIEYYYLENFYLNKISECKYEINQIIYKLEKKMNCYLSAKYRSLILRLIVNCIQSYPFALHIISSENIKKNMTRLLFISCIGSINPFLYSDFLGYSIEIINEELILESLSHISTYNVSDFLNEEIVTRFVSKSILKKGFECVHPSKLLDLVKNDKLEVILDSVILKYILTKCNATDVGDLVCSLSSFCTHFTEDLVKYAICKDPMNSHVILFNSNIEVSRELLEYSIRNSGQCHMFVNCEEIENYMCIEVLHLLLEECSSAIYIRQIACNEIVRDYMNTEILIKAISKSNYLGIVCMLNYYPEYICENVLYQVILKLGTGTQLIEMLVKFQNYISYRILILAIDKCPCSYYIYLILKNEYIKLIVLSDKDNISNLLLYSINKITINEFLLMLLIEYRDYITLDIKNAVLSKCNPNDSTCCEIYELIEQY